jgi:hypothetical protein
MIAALLPALLPVLGDLLKRWFLGLFRSASRRLLAADADANPSSC